jgi:hypothetical protein
MRPGDQSPSKFDGVEIAFAWRIDLPSLGRPDSIAKTWLLEMAK